MNKALIILVLAIVLSALWTFNSSFVASSAQGYAQSTSAVIAAHAGFVSVRAVFTVIPEPGTIANVSFADGSQKQVGSVIPI